MLKLAQVGTFDVDNYGDLLFPAILHQALQSRVQAFDLSLYSPNACTFTVDRPYRCKAMAELRLQKDVDAVVIGSGQILHANFRFLLDVYRCVLPFSKFPDRVATVLKRCRKVWDRMTGFQALTDSKQWESVFGYPCVAPFILQRNALPPRCRVVYNACGVSELRGILCEEDCKRACEAFEEADHLSVRDRPSERFLREIGVRRSIPVVPDTALLLPRSLDTDELHKKAQRALADIGMEPTRRFLCVQATAPSMYQDGFADAIRSFAEEHSLEVVLLPTRSWAEDFRRSRRVCAIRSATVSFLRKTAGAHDDCRRHCALELRCDVRVAQSRHRGCLWETLAAPSLPAAPRY